MGTFQVKEGEAEALRRAHREQALPFVKQQPGMVANMLLEPVKPGDPFVAVTVWNTREDGERYEGSGAAGAVVAMLKSFFAGPPVLVTYETHSHTLGG
jgi:heme-degrading monooxygenase HmoA